MYWNPLESVLDNTVEVSRTPTLTLKPNTFKNSQLPSGHFHLALGHNHISGTYFSLFSSFDFSSKCVNSSMSTTELQYYTKKRKNKKHSQWQQFPLTSGLRPSLLPFHWNPLHIHIKALFLWVVESLTPMTPAPETHQRFGFLLKQGQPICQILISKRPIWWKCSIGLAKQASTMSHFTFLSAWLTRVTNLMLYFVQSSLKGSSSLEISQKP